VAGGKRIAPNAVETGDDVRNRAEEGSEEVLYEARGVEAAGPSKELDFSFLDTLDAIPVLDNSPFSGLPTTEGNILNSFHPARLQEPRNDRHTTSPSTALSIFPPPSTSTSYTPTYYPSPSTDTHFLIVHSLTTVAALLTNANLLRIACNTAQPREL